MRKTIICIAAFLSSSGIALADNPGCEAFKWPVTREQALFQSAPEVQPGVALAVGEAVDLRLAAIDTISFAVPPARTPVAGTFGGTASVIVPPEGLLQVSLSGEAWVDVVQGGHATRAIGYSGVKTCQGIRKSVRFKLTAGPAILQFSGASRPDIKVAVLTPE
jgi:hypothetical protein